MPANDAGTPHRPDRVEPQRRLQPRAADHGPASRGLDLEQTRCRADHRHGRPPSTRTRRSCSSTPTRVSATPTGRSWTPTQPTSRPAAVRPPDRNLTEGHRYVVALRDCGDGDGSTIEAPTSRSGPSGTGWTRRTTPSSTPADAMEQVFDDLDEAGVDREELVPGLGLHGRQRATASPRRLLHMRDDAFDDLGRRRAGVRRGRRPRRRGGRSGGSPARSRCPVPHRRRRVRLGVEQRRRARRHPRGATGPRRRGSSASCRPAGADGGPTGDGPLRPRPARAAPRRCWAPPPWSRRRPTCTFCATDWIGMSEDDLANVAGVLERPRRVPVDPRPAAAGRSSTSCSSGGC